MSEELFRIVVAVGVGLASIAFVIQACVVFALYRAGRKMQSETSAFIRRVEPIIAKVEPALDKAGPLIDKIGPVVERIEPVLQKTAVALDKVPAVMEKVQIVVGQAGVLTQRAIDLAASANQVVVTANNIMLDARPDIKEIADEAAAIVRTGREQVERMGELLHDAGEVARTRIQQIDQAVTSTVEHVEHVGESVKGAVMRPVREVNGLAAGISAAVSTLVRGQRKSSVDAATQDEEMFI
ncbi:MAG TPA: hypothetical protein VGF49_11415 [Candidatus Solibacter sp.]